MQSIRFDFKLLKNAVYRTEAKLEHPVKTTQCTSKLAKIKDRSSTSTQKRRLPQFEEHLTNKQPQRHNYV